VIGALWIILSDKLLFQLGKTGLLSADAQELLGSSKGLLYILITTTLLYFMLKRSFAKEQRNQQNLQSLINNTDGAMWSVDKELNIISANERYSKIVKRSSNAANEIYTPSLTQAFAPERKAQWKAFYEQALQGEAYLVEIASPPIKGQSHFTEVSFNPIKDAREAVIGVSCHARDITESKLYRIKIERQNELLQEIAWLQSHGVRAPVATIQGLLSIFNYSNPADPANREVLSNLKLTAQQLDNIIHEIVEKTNDVENTSETVLIRNRPNRNA
jgi:PAS domain S-box-containing protein